jgi:hypothetical protein
MGWGTALPEQILLRGGDRIFLGGLPLDASNPKAGNMCRQAVKMQNGPERQGSRRTSKNKSRIPTFVTPLTLAQSRWKQAPTVGAVGALGLWVECEAAVGQYPEEGEDAVEDDEEVVQELVQAGGGPPSD